MIFDIHTHNFLCDVSLLAARAKECGVARFVLLGDVFRHGVFQTPEQVTEINDLTLSDCRRFPREARGFCYLNPFNPVETIEKELRLRASQPEFKGAKLEVSCNCTRKELDPVMELLKELKWPLMQHCWGHRTSQESTSVFDLVDLAKRHPGNTIICAHLLGCGYAGVEAMEFCPNVLTDVSGSQPESGVLEYAVKRLGPERILYGSDAPGRDMAVQIAKVTGADIPEEAKECILHTNAERILSCSVM